MVLCLCLNKKVRWILKMHGTVSHPEEIVLTKQDYIRYHERFAALAGIVQSTLLTRHLFSVGFSLDDDNFQRIFDSVRKARHPVVGLTEQQDWKNVIKRMKQKFGDEKIEQDEDFKHEVVSDREDFNSCCGTALMLEYSNLKV
jgi:uncharacterized short protein YbdD (DUF466 family)